MATSSPSPPVAPIVEPTSLEGALLDLVPNLECEPVRDEDEISTVAAQASIACSTTDGEIDQLSLSVFDGAEALRQRWVAEVAATDEDLEVSESACEDGTSGMREWGFGELACTIDGETVSLHWTDRRIAAYGVIESGSANLSDLFEWWREQARRLGRLAQEDAGNQEPNEGEATDVPPLVRVPGRPANLTCEPSSETITDLHDRRWRVRRVRFVDRRGYERVVLELRRTGRARNGGGAQAVIERVPISQLGAVLPNGPRPRRGSAALILRLSGVVDGPDLRRYRPQGVSLVRELSMLSRNGGRIVLLGISGQACHQVRIPVWGASASGRERSAEIYIDLSRQAAG